MVPDWGDVPSFVKHAVASAGYREGWSCSAGKTFCERDEAGAESSNAYLDRLDGFLRWSNRTGADQPCVALAVFLIRCGVPVLLLTDRMGFTKERVEDAMMCDRNTAIRQVPVKPSER